MKVKKLFLLFFISICFLCTFNYQVVYAASIDDSNEEVKKNITFFWAYLNEKGYTDYAIAGIVGNFYWESGGFKTDAIEKSNGEGYGLGQWSSDRKTNFFTWCKENGYDKTELSTQCEFLIHENDKFGNYQAGSFTYKAVVSNLEEYSTYNWSSPTEAATAFCWGWERCGYSTSGISTRQEYAEDAYKKFGGTTAESGGGTSGSTVDFSQMGWLAEDTFGVPKQLTDTGVYLPDDVRDLSQADRTQISRWKEDIEATSDSVVIDTMRAVVAFFGIIMILYSTILYIAYWFDRINNFIDISLLGLLTMGRLEISPDDKTSTFSPKTRGLKVVVHKDIIFICLTGIVIGVLILTGKIYWVIGKFIEVVKGIFN